MRPRLFTPKWTPPSGEPPTRPVSLVYHFNEPPRRSASAQITPGRNQSHRLLSLSVSRLCLFPAASTTKKAVGATLSPRTIGLSAPDSTHSVRQSSPMIRYSFGALFFVV